MTENSLPINQTPVGELLGEELEFRGWSQADFAAVIDRPTQFVSEIVTGKKEITRESAAQIGAALSQTPEFWLKLQDQYGDGKIKGSRLSNPRDPVVRAALKHPCPDCKAEPDQWCIGVAKDSRTNGRRRARLHFARCSFSPEQP